MASSVRIRSLIKACPVFDITGVPPAAVTTASVFQVRRGSWIIFAPGCFFQKRFRQQPDDVVPLDKLPFLIEQEAAVEVAVKGDAHVRPVFNNGLAGVVATLRQQRVGNAVREGAVRGVVDFDELHRRAQRLQTRFDGVNDGPPRRCRNSPPASAG